MGVGKCWCGGNLQVEECWGNHPDLTELFKYNAMQCDCCMVQSQTVGQIEDAKASIARAIAAESTKDFDKEAEEAIQRLTERGLLIPKELKGLPPMELLFEIESHTFSHIFVQDIQGRLRIGQEDYHDGMYTTLTEDQEAELFMLLSERANVTLESA